MDFFSIEKVFFQHQELFQHPKGVFSAPGVFSASTVFYQHLRCFSSTRKECFCSIRKVFFDDQVFSPHPEVFFQHQNECFLSTELVFFEHQGVFSTPAVFFQHLGSGVFAAPKRRFSSTRTVFFAQSFFLSSCRARSRLWRSSKRFVFD